jgi:hypothetical protein
LRLWEVLALRGDDALRILPSPVRDLTEIGRPLDAHVRLVLGKQLDPQRHSARVHRLGAGGVELESSVALTVFGAVQVLVPTSMDGNEPEALDGKVVGLSERDGTPTAIVRFTGLGWETRERVEGIARRARDLTVLRPGPA